MNWYNQNFHFIHFFDLITSEDHRHYQKQELAEYLGTIDEQQLYLYKNLSLDLFCTKLF